MKTAECVAAHADVSAAAARKWLGRESAPNNLATFKLIAAYGPEFLVAIFPRAPVWLSAAHRTEKAAEIERQLTALQAKRDAL